MSKVKSFATKPKRHSFALLKAAGSGTYIQPAKMAFTLGTVTR